MGNLRDKTNYGGINFPRVFEKEFDNLLIDANKWLVDERTTCRWKRIQFVKDQEKGEKIVVYNEEKKK